MSLNRRTFLRRSAASVSAGAVTYFLPPFAQPELAAQESKLNQIRIAAIGVKNQGLPNMKKHTKNIVGVCDVDKNVLGAAAKVLEAANVKPLLTVGDYRRILDSKEVDAVIVTTPDHWHAKITVDACNAGKDVYCEKPLTLTVAEGRAMVIAARRNKRIVQTGSQQRSDNRFRLACELVRSGRIGKIKEVKVGIPGPNFKGPPVADKMPPAELDYDFWLGPAPKRPYNEKRVHYLFRFFWDYSGGQLTNFGAHHLDIAQWGLGMDESGPVKVSAKARFHKDMWYETPEWCEILYTYANGVKMICGMSEKGGTTFIGEKGTIHVNRGTISSTPAEIVKEPLLDTDVHLYVSKNHHDDWLSCIRSRKLPICDVEIGHRSATVCHLGNIAIRVGREIAWDPKAETISGDMEASAMLHKPYREPWKIVLQAD
ncbi:MAG: Gfo/Idh/MocA family oxidoreductase [Zavarzinella sp.]